MLFSLDPSFQWTCNNHLTCGFHRNPSGVVDKNIFFSKVGSPRRKIYTAFKEAQIAAAIIYRETKTIRKEFFLCLSGGIDSEAMLRAFMASEVPFHAIIMRFNNSLNDFDIEEMIQFCDKNHISYEVFDLNVFDFFESGKYLLYGERYQCQSPQLATHLYLCDHIKGCPVLSWQPPEAFFHLNSKHKLQRFSFGLPGHLHSVLLRYFVKNNRWGVPFFFLYTTELLGAFFQLPLLQKMIWFGQRGADVHYSYEIKCLTYRHAGFNVHPKKDSYTGFEKIKDHYDHLDKKSYGKGFNDRYRTPLKKLNPLPKTFYQIVPRNMYCHPEQVQELNERYEKQLPQTDPNLLFKEEISHFLQNNKTDAVLQHQQLRQQDEECKKTAAI